MPMDSDAELRALYADLLDGPADQRRLRLLRHLDAGYRVVHHGLVRTPQSLPPVRALPPGASRAGRWGARWPRPRRLRWHLSLPALVVLACGLCVTLAIAASSIVNLGQPTNSQSTNPYFPLSGFHRGSAALQSSGKPEFLWIGTAWPGDAPSDVERWPVVKALEQFGSFSGMAIGPQRCITTTYYAYSGPVTEHPCTLATFDWAHSQYHSRYVAFVHKDLIDARARLLQRLSPQEGRLFDRYVRQKPGNSVKALASSLYDPYSIPAMPGRVFPLLAVGGYVETQTSEPLIGDFGSPRWLGDADVQITHHLTFALYTQTLTFTQARDALSTGTTPHLPGIAGEPPPSFSGLLPDVNGEANVITALICHADGGKPAAVCGRPVIKHVLKHVK